MYNPTSSSSISIQNFGAACDGVTSDTYAIQQAINFCENSPNIKTLIFPNQRILTTGILWVTGNNLNFQGNGIATLISNGENDYQKFYLSGCSGVTFDGLNLFGGRAVGTANNYSGLLTATNTSLLTIKNSNLRDTQGMGVLFNGSNYSPTIDNNVFQNFCIGIFSQSISSSTVVNGTGLIQKARFTNNTFLDSWGTASQQNYFGGIKLQALLSDSNNNISGYSNGNIISNNKFQNTSQMGIELWGNIEDSVVSNNTIDNAVFGISIAHSSRNIIVANNTVKAGPVSTWGIESADCTFVTIQGNSIYGITGSGLLVANQLTYGIMVDGTNTKPAYCTISNNLVIGGGNSIITYAQSNTIDIVGNIIIQSGGYGQQGICYHNQGSSNINFSNNKVTAYSGVYFVFLDNDSTINASGVTISNNDFVGSVTNWGILYYNNNNSGNWQNVLIENNRTYGIQNCGFGMVDTSDYPPISCTHRNNFGNTGSIGYFIPDLSIPTSTAPYGATNTQHGLVYYGSQKYTIPTSGVTGNGIWLCVWSGGGAIVNNLKANIYSDTSLGDNGTNMDIFASMAPPLGGGLTDSLTVMPQGTYDNTLIKTVRTNGTLGSINNCQLWVLLGPINSGSAGSNDFTVYYSDNNFLSSIYSTYTEPTWGSNSVQVIPNRSYQNLALSRGVTFNNDSSIYSTNTGVLNIAAASGVIVAAPYLSTNLSGSSFDTNYNTFFFNGHALNSGSSSGNGVFDFYGSILPITVYARNVQVQSGTTAVDIGIITLPSGINRWHLPSSPTTSIIIFESGTAYTAGATFGIFDKPAGAGNNLIAATAAPTTTGTSTSWVGSPSMISYSPNIYIRQATTGTSSATGQFMSFYLTIFPIP